MDNSGTGPHHGNSQWDDQGSHVPGARTNAVPVSTSGGKKMPTNLILVGVRLWSPQGKTLESNCPPSEKRLLTRLLVAQTVTWPLPYFS